eukprot:3135627-Amphidinium_carterae.2
MHICLHRSSRSWSGTTPQVRARICAKEAKGRGPVHGRSFGRGTQALDVSRAVSSGGLHGTGG